MTSDQVIGSADARPRQRLIEPEEVAEAVAYLLGPGGRAMTGVPLTMGSTAR